MNALIIIGVVLEGGTIVVAGTPDEVKSEPESRIGKYL